MMKRLMMAVSCACIFGIAGLSATQAEKADKDAKATTVTGCVSLKNGHLLLTEVLMTGDLKRDMQTSMKGDMKPASYDLAGSEMTSHVGHKVELTGMLAPNTAARDKSKMDTETMGVPDVHGTLTVSAIKMISTSCP